MFSQNLFPMIIGFSTSSQSFTASKANIGFRYERDRGFTSVPQIEDSHLYPQIEDSLLYPQIELVKIKITYSTLN